MGIRKTIQTFFKPKPQLPPFTRETYEQFMSNTDSRRYGRDWLAEYTARLPIIMLSRCPFCQHPLLYQFDPYSLHGLWWKGWINSHPPASACKHFVVLEGALNFNGLGPPENKGIDRAISADVGPDVPFVVPSHLAYSVAVIHQVAVCDKYSTYPIGYFSKHTGLFSTTRRGWTTDTGWGVDFKSYDYDLAPYLLAGQVYWLDPNDPQHPVKQGKPDACPYYNLPGERRPQHVSHGKLIYGQNPDGNNQPDPYGLLKNLKK